MKYLLLCLILVGCDNGEEYEDELANRAMSKWCTHEQMNMVISQVKQCTAKGGNVNHCWNVGIINSCGGGNGRSR